MPNQQKKNSNKVTIKNTKGRKEIAAVILFAIGLFTFISLLGKTGIIGRFIRGLLYGMFGRLTTIVMLCMVFVIAWCILRGTAERVFAVKNCVLFGVLLLVFAALVHTIGYRESAYDGMNFLQVIGVLWTDQNNGGGLIGGGVSVILQKLVARPGAFVILIPTVIILSMILFSLSIVNFARSATSAGRGVVSWISAVRVRFRNSSGGAAIRQKGISDNTASGEREIAALAAPDEYDEDDIPDIDDEIEFVSVSAKRRRAKADEMAADESRAENRADGIIDRHSNGVYVDAEAQRQPLPDVASSIPTKIPDPTATINIVTSDDSIVYTTPPTSMLMSVEETNNRHDEQKRQATATARKLEEVMRSFGIESRVIHISRGSTVTMYELQPHSGVKVSKIKNLSDDIAMNLAASGIRIEAPIPGKAAIGIEVPNQEKRIVYLKDLIETEEFARHSSKIAFCLGEDISGVPVISDIAKMPHMLIAGTTGSGKSVCINCLIVSLLYKSSPNDVRLIMIDPKVVELQMYNGIPHLLIPVVTEPKKAAAALSWAVQEMENRYQQFARCNIRDIDSYNKHAEANGLPTLPRIVIIIDELADLMMVVRDSIEEAINRIAQKARAAGMHLIVATQRPSVDVVTGLIKSNIPSRIAFAVSSQVDSKTILDYGGAEKLLGRGDMLYCPVGSLKAVRVQGGFVSDGEIEKIVEYIKSSAGEASYDDDISAEINNARLLEKPRSRGGVGASADMGGGGADDGDEMFEQAVDIAIEMKQISASFLQRRLKIGYNRASRMIDQMEEMGYISARDGNNPRQVLITEHPSQSQSQS